MPQNYSSLKNVSGAAWYGTTTNQTGFLDLPKGTTAQRPNTPTSGMARYNTTIGAFEYYITDWTQFSGLGITSVSPTSYNGANGTTFTITGSGFVAGTSVKFITNTGTAYTAGTITINNLTSITATTPRAFTVSEEPLDIQVVSPAGQTATLQDVIDCGGSPTWSTAAGTIATVGDRFGSYSPIVTLSATDPESQTVTYSIASGALPGNVTLNTSTGAISGDPTDVVSDTTYNFTANATDTIGNATSRSFSIIVNLTKDGSSSSRATTSSVAIKALDSSAATGWYWIDLDGTPRQYWVDMDYDGGGWVLVMNHYTGVAINNLTYAQSTNAYNYIGSSSLTVGSGSPYNYSFMLALAGWNTLATRNGAGRNVLLNASGSAQGLSGAASRRSRWTWTGWSATYAPTGPSGIVNVTGGSTPGMYSYHWAQGVGWSTTDNDQDTYSSNCASAFGNAPWWYVNCWDGSFWGGNGGPGYANAIFWTGSAGDYYTHGSCYVK